MSSAKNIDDYIQSKPVEAQTKLNEIRVIIGQVFPAGIETLKWGEPAILDADGMILIIFAAYTQHMNLVTTPSVIQSLEDELTGFKTGKGSVQFIYEKPLPTKLIEKIVRSRVQEYREQGIKWK